MSSIASVWNQTQQPGYVFTEKDWNHQAEAECTKLGKETPGRIIYSASKNAGERVFWEWREKNNPTFAMSAVNPVYVLLFFYASIVLISNVSISNQQRILI